jgi:hypothetical protein
MPSLTGVSTLTCPICDASSGNRFIVPNCGHYHYDEQYDEELPFVVCAGCEQFRPFNIRTSDADGGEFFCSMRCLRAARS